MAKPNDIKKTRSLRPTSEGVEINLVDLVRYLFNHKLFIGLATVALPVMIGMWSVFVKKPVFKSNSVINVNLSSKSQTFSLERFSYWFEEQEMLNKIYMTEQFFGSARYRRELLNEVEGRTAYCSGFKACDTYRRVIKNYVEGMRLNTDSDKADFLFSHLDIFADPDRYSMVISGSTPDPYVSLALTDLAAITLLELNHNLLLERTSKIKKFLDKQTSITREELDRLEEELVALQQKYKIFATPEVQTKLHNVYLEERVRLDSARRDYAAAELLIRELSDEISQFRTQMASDDGVSQLYLSQVQRRFDMLKYQKSINESGRNPAEAQNFNQEYKQYQDILKQNTNGMISFDPWQALADMEKLLAETKSKRTKLASEISAATGTLKENDRTYGQFPDVFRKISDLQRNISLTTELYGLLKTRLQETQIQEAGRTNDLLIVSFAERARKPSGMGGFKRTVLGAAGGMSLSVLMLFMIYILIPTIRNKSDLDQMGIQVVGEYNMFATNRVGMMGDRSQAIILRTQGITAEANAIRYTRFRIEQILEIEKGLDSKFGKVISMCSVSSGDGKTFTAANLAYAFSLADFRVLLVDGDFEKSDLRNFFPELTHPEELKIVNEDERVHFARGQIRKNLHLMDAEHFTASAVDYVESMHFQNFLKTLKEDYDVIIIDTPPIKGNLTPILFARQADAVIFVANQRSTIRDDMIFNVAKLRESFPGSILGVLNFIYDDIASRRGKKKPKLTRSSGGGSTSAAA